MKKLLVVPLLLILAEVTKAAPYLYLPTTQGYQWQVSEGVLFDAKMSAASEFTNVPIIYHPLSSGSIIPTEFQQYLPPESWSLDLGAGVNGGNTRIGIGIGINLLDSVRAWGSNLLAMSSIPALNVIGKQIAPGVGPLNLHADYQPTVGIINSGVIAVNQWKITNSWFFGPSYSF